MIIALMIALIVMLIFQLQSSVKWTTMSFEWYVSESLTYFFHPAKFADHVKAHELTKH